MKKNNRASETPSDKLVTARKEVASRLEQAKAAAKEVAELCDRAAKAARNLKVPPAGMGKRQPSPDT
jgi:hypothetical protein